MATSIKSNKSNSATVHTWLKQFSDRPEGIAVRYKKDSEWKSFTWSQYLKMITHFHFILKGKGYKPQMHVALMASTRWEWAAFDVAVVASRGILAPLYPNLSDDDVAYILDHCDADILIVENKKLLAQYERVRDRVTRPLEVIRMDDLDLDASYVDDKMVDEFLALSAEMKPTDDISIIYTSGTTGQPKGVVLQQRALTSEVNEAFALFEVDSADTSLSFLPYAHVMGRIEHWGSCCAGYTLAFAESIDMIKKNLSYIKPTFLIAVPRIFEKIYAGILNQVETQSLKKKVFYQALEVSKQVQYYRQTRQSIPLLLLAQHEALSRVVFAPVKKAFGGRLRFAISGGAPLSPDLGVFFNNVGIRILEGYGLTETFAAITVNSEHHWNLGTVGRPIGDVELRFEADGEILVKSHKCMREYYKNPEATAQVFKDGFFCTGDIGELTPDGYLKITDRKKDLIKTAGGKYVAPQKIEGLLKQEPLISQVLIHGDQRKFISALLVVEAENEPREAIVDRIKKHVQKVNAELASYEALKKYEVLFTQWTVDNGALTPSLKVKRKVLEKKYADIIQSFYE